jgi:hypothetical protein
MFVVVTVACVSLAVVLHRARARRGALRAIDELGGGYSITIGGPAWLRSIVKDDKYFYDIKRVSFESKPERAFTDDDLAFVVDSINVFKQPKIIHLLRTDVTDDGLRHVCRVHDVEQVWLDENPKVTAEGAAQLQRAIPSCQVQYTGPD